MGDAIKASPIFYRTESKDAMKREEYETIFLYNDQDRAWEVSTNIPKHQNLLQSRGWKEVARCGDEVAYVGPKNGLTIRNLNNKRKEQTPEQKEAAAKRLSEMRQKTQNASVE